MEQKNEKDTGTQSLFAAWIKSSMEMWENMVNVQKDMPPFPGAAEKSDKNRAYKAQKTMETGLKVFQSMMMSLSEPENVDALLKGLDSLPDFMINISQQVWDGYAELQKQWADRIAKLGKHTEAYKFEDLDQEYFETIKELYEREFQKYFKVPQLGLTRFYQERFNELIDKYNVYETHMGEFVYMFYVPIEKSLMVLQEKVEKMAEEGEIIDNYKEYYNMWIKILEGHYMTLLQSKEYTQVMDRMINSLVQYRKAKDEVYCDFFQNFPIPTNREMDELYKEFHLLKKQVRELSKKLEDQD